MKKPIDMSCNLMHGISDKMDLQKLYSIEVFVIFEEKFAWDFMEKLKIHAYKGLKGKIIKDLKELTGN